MYTCTISSVPLPLSRHTRLSICNHSPENKTEFLLLMLSFVSYSELYQSFPRPGPVQVSVNTQRDIVGRITRPVTFHTKSATKTKRVCERNLLREPFSVLLLLLRETKGVIRLSYRHSVVTRLNICACACVCVLCVLGGLCKNMFF